MNHYFNRKNIVRHISAFTFVALIFIFTFTPYEYKTVSVSSFLNFYDLAFGKSITESIRIEGQIGTFFSFLFLEIGIIGFSLTLKRAYTSIRERTYDVLFIILAIMSAIFLIIGAVTLLSFSSNGVPYFYIVQGIIGLIAFVYIIIDALMSRY